MRYSVIIPVFNKGAILRDALNSILAQESGDYEIIVVDDGSRVPVAEELNNEYADAPVQIIRQNNGGVSVARNTGIQQAIGEYVCFLDADDVWLPEHLTVLDELICKYDHPAMMVTSNRKRFDDGKEHDSSKWLTDCQDDFVITDLFKMLVDKSGSIIHTNSVCIKREVLLKEKIFFEPGAVRGEDTDVWFRVALHFPVVMTKRVTTIYRCEYSTATKDGNYIANWVFAMREKEILQDGNVTEEVKRSFINFLDRYWLTSAREAYVRSQRDEIHKYLNKVGNKRTKAYCITWIYVHCPNTLANMLSKLYAWYKYRKVRRKAMPHKSHIL